MYICAKSVNGKCKEAKETGRELCNGLYVGCGDYYKPSKSTELNEEKIKTTKTTKTKE